MNNRKTLSASDMPTSGNIEIVATCEKKTRIHENVHRRRVIVSQVLIFSILAIIASAALADERNKKVCVPADEKELIELVKQKGIKMRHGEYKLKFLNGENHYTIDYYDKDAINKPNNKIDNYDGIVLIKEKIEPLKEGESKKYTHVTICDDYVYFQDDNIDGHASMFRQFGYKPKLECDIPYNKTNQKFHKLIKETTSIIKKGDYKSAEKVMIRSCD